MKEISISGMRKALKGCVFQRLGEGTTLNIDLVLFGNKMQCFLGPWWLLFLKTGQIFEYLCEQDSWGTLGRAVCC